MALDRPRRLRDNSDFWDTQKGASGRGEFLLQLLSRRDGRRDSYRHYLSRFLDVHYRRGVSDIHQGLYGTDYNGFSDPFVRVQLLPLTKTGDTKQTKTLHKTINPEFGETLVFHADEPLDARKLRLTVMDDYQFGSYPLGEATVPLSLLTPNQMCWLNVALDKCLDRDALCADRPRVLVSLMHCRRRRELHVGLLRCVRLRHAAAGTGPFVRITLKPDASQPSCETSTVKKMLSPQSNDEFAFELKENDNLEKKFLQISVWDKDQGRADEYLGGLELGLHCKAAQLQHWLDVIRVPEQSFECWHALVPVPLLP